MIYYIIIKMKGNLPSIDLL